MTRSLLVSLALASCCVGLASCAAGGGGLDLLPIPPQTVAVNDTLRIPLDVRTAHPTTVQYSFSGPMLVGLDRVATIANAGGEAEFRWTPLSSQVGMYPFTFVATSPEGQDRETVLITVTPAADAAPVFLQPGSGGTYDLTHDPCVAFDIEVRDDDSADVEIAARAELPAGAELMPDADSSKRASFHWCPTPDQVDASARWTIELSADDHDHAPTEKDYIVVLRGLTSMDCPGAPPMISISSPAMGAHVTEHGGYVVSAAASDDMGLRDAPLLYYTTTMPEDPSMPDVSTFDQVVFMQDASSMTWQATIPALGLADGMQQTVFIFGSATDNDDATGATCDHTTDSAVTSFVAVGSADAGGTAVPCDACTRSTDCASGICATAAAGARCLAACGGGDSPACTAGTCGSVTTAEGGSVSACGGVAQACFGGTTCHDDSREPNDTRATATTGVTMVTDGVICRDNDDYYRIDVMAGAMVSVTTHFDTTEGDLDLQLFDSSGRILASSDGVTNSEMVSYCSSAAQTLYAHVYGFDSAQAHYSMTVANTAGACMACIDDSGEPDDTRTHPRMVSPGASVITGSICPANSDYLAFNVGAPSHVVISIVFDATADLDLDLYGPDGTIVASSHGSTDTENIDTNLVATGTYALRVFGHTSATAGMYTGDLTITASTGGCTATRLCPSGQVCRSGSCVPDTCSSTAMCPPMHLCPAAGPIATPSSCAAACAVNGDCRANEACKWFPEGRGCGVHGAHANGDACATFRDCGAQRACLGWPGGYCARAGCHRASDCESGTYCVMVGSTSVCAKDCAADPTGCRAGYSCSMLSDVTATPESVCVPPGSTP